MPTPFQHLIYAKDVLEDPTLPEAIRRQLEAEESAYLLGSTAVDVQAITGQSRRETHFYTLPATPHLRAGKVMRERYPQLSNPYCLSPDQAAFISGYLVHLAWDEDWAWDVFSPYYLEGSWWPDRLTRSVHHNALRVVLDRHALQTLRNWPGIADLLKRAEPHHWLPFVPDEALRRWRDWIVEQLEDPDRIQTVRVFAERMGVTPEHLEEVARQIEKGTFHPHLPGLEEALKRFVWHAHQDSLRALRQYWGFDKEVLPVEFLHAACAAEDAPDVRAYDPAAIVEQ